MSEQTTKDRILDCAEQLFSKQGFTGTSLRTIIKAAGVNTAAIHYHFGSREGLLEAVIARRAQPVNERRLEMLEALETRHADATPPVREVVEAFLMPAFQLLFRKSHRHRQLAQLMSRAIMDSSAETRDVLRGIFGSVAARFMAAFGRAAPYVPADEIMWRFHFMLGSMAFFAAVPPAFEEHSRTGDADLAHLMERLIDFCTAGMAAPSSKQVRGRRV
jgi:AcrR family transcriptional regulator